MARTVIPVTRASRAGTVLPAAQPGDLTNGLSMPNDGKTLLLVSNAAGTAAHTVTFNYFRTVDGQAVTPRAEAVPMGETHVFGPFPVEDFGAALSIDADNAELTFQALKV